MDPGRDGSLFYSWIVALVIDFLALIRAFSYLDEKLGSHPLAVGRV
jgi:hypothetical protein